MHRLNVRLLLPSIAAILLLSGCGQAGTSADGNPGPSPGSGTTVTAASPAVAAVVKASPVVAAPVAVAVPVAAPVAVPVVAPPPDPYAAAKAAGASAVCADGTLSFSKNRSGTCSSHGGVHWWTGNLGPAGPGAH
jgi:hypothetical protein